MKLKQSTRDDIEIQDTEILLIDWHHLNPTLGIYSPSCIFIYLTVSNSTVRTYLLNEFICSISDEQLIKYKVILWHYSSLRC